MMNRITTLSLVSVFAMSLVATTNAEPVKVSLDRDSAKPEVKHVAPLSERFAKADTDAVPDFQKHVVPLLGRLGCNGRACHGSFQGRGGFQLSLFGYDFKGDHKALMDENTGRVDLDDIDESLMLAKPSDADLHEGGKRFDVGTWQHHVLRRWVESGAKFDHPQPLKLKKLEIIPSEIQFTSAKDAVELKAVAHWADGTVEDVTEVCRFSSNDKSIADIDEHGHLNAGEQGDTHVVVYYDNAVVPVPVIRPIGPSQQVAKAKKPVDRLIQEKLDKLGIVSSELCTDSEFIRRASLDITGILPTADRVRQFLADESPNKRSELMEELLASPGYAQWWATRFSDWTGNSEEQLNNVLPVRGAGTRIWHEWLRTRLADNMPYDKIIEGIVTAKNREDGEEYKEYCENMTEACKPGKEGKFAEREGLPLYWARRNFAKPEERAIGFAYTFLGVRIECAQCHKHPFDQWSKDDFDQFAKLFTTVRYNQNQVRPEDKAARQKLIDNISNGKKMNNGDLRRAIYAAARKGETVPFGELLVRTSKVSEKVLKQRAIAKKKGRKLQPLPVSKGTILGGDEVELSMDPRPALMDWLRDPKNPYFAKAVVNRVWSNYFGIGIVDPTDDMNLANPPSNAALLDYLAKQFIKHDFDLMWLHREIVSSDAYQRSSDTNDTNVSDRLNFARHIPRRLPAEVVYDSMVLATGSDKKQSDVRKDMDTMAIADGKTRNRNRGEYALEVFGQSIRETNCDCDRSDSPSLLQSIYLRNDADMHKRLADKDGWVAQACKSIGVPGPKGGVDPKQASKERAAKAYQKQIVNRLRQIKKIPAERRKKMLDSTRKQYAKAKAKLKVIGYSMPSLAELMKNPDAWMTEGLQPLSGNDKVGTASKTVDTLVEDAYLRTLSRYPDNEEREVSVSFIEESETPADGIQSLLWALVNTKEFIITH